MVRILVYEFSRKEGNQQDQVFHFDDPEDRTLTKLCLNFPNENRLQVKNYGHEFEYNPEYLNFR